jgi:hypothetical protein
LVLYYQIFGKAARGEFPSDKLFQADKSSRKININDETGNNIP